MLKITPGAIARELGGRTIKKRRSARRATRGGITRSSAMCGLSRHGDIAVQKTGSTRVHVRPADVRSGRTSRHSGR